jgi:formylglycine-generating enzyme required for sulfatase activity
MREPHAGEGCERRHRMGRKVCGSAAEAIGSRAWRLVALVTAALPLMGCGQASDDVLPAESFVLIEGGTFRMGDVFGDGEAHERPVHSVTVSDFYLSRYEVTVTEFSTFVEETGYSTSAGGPVDLEAHREIMDQAVSGKLSSEELGELQARILELSGAALWDADARRWVGYDPQVNWTAPGFPQGPNHPAVALSWDDAIRFCNWLSERAGLPPAYDEETGAFLDESGEPTDDVTKVKGFRLPTEAEWEYAAREGGREVRFGNGESVARSSQINFMGDVGEYEFLELGGYERRTVPVGSYPPNAFGLFDMSGNAWEWVSDRFGSYQSAAQTDPYTLKGDEQILRGGRWGGDAFEARVFHRSSWVRNDRCNNSGFRVAVSAG